MEARLFGCLTSLRDRGRGDGKEDKSLIQGGYKIWPSPHHNFFLLPLRCDIQDMPDQG